MSSVYYDNRSRVIAFATIYHRFWSPTINYTQRSLTNTNITTPFLAAEQPFGFHFNELKKQLSKKELTIQQFLVKIEHPMNCFCNCHVTIRITGDPFTKYT